MSNRQQALVRTANRLARRRLLGTAALAGGGAAVAVACGGSKSRTESTGDAPGESRLQAPATGQVAPGANEQVKRGGTFTAVEGPPRSLDPHFDTFPANTHVTDNVYSALLYFNDDVTKIELDLAQAMPEQPDASTYVFKIRQGVKFQNVAPANGREATAEDVKYSFERQMTNDPGKFQHAYYFLNRISRIETVDKYTVKFTMTKPYAPFLSYVASPWTLVILPELVEKEGDLTTKAVGTGPFIFEEWQKDVQHKLRRNPDYFKMGADGKALPYVDNLVIKIITDPNAVQAQFASGALDMAGIEFTFKDEIQKKLPKANYRAVSSQFWRQMRTSPYDGDKFQHKRPYTDIRVRQALVQAVNKKEMLDTVFSGDGVPAYGPILPIYPTWALKEDPVKYDPADSKKLLEAAGFANGLDEEMIFDNSAGEIPNNVAEVLKQQLSKIGVRLTLRGMERTAYYNKTYAYDYGMSHHVPLNQPDPDENLSSYFGRTSTFYKWGNREIWDMIDKQAETVDNTERQKLVLEVQRKIALDYPMSFIYTPNSHRFTQARVKGWFFPNDYYNGRRELVWIDPTA
jgi:peptide/nickel transport system substrate-binding protein